jgi:hypothetical protein
MWDRTGENQVYVRQQKAAEEQLRFDKTEKPSRLASKEYGSEGKFISFADFEPAELFLFPVEFHDIGEGPC